MKYRVILIFVSDSIKELLGSGSGRIQGLLDPYPDGDFLLDPDSIEYGSETTERGQVKATINRRM